MEDVLQKKLAKVIGTGNSPRRLSSTYARAQPHPALMKRAVSVHSTTPRLELAALKSLAVILYLCQYGAPAFMEWLRAQYRALVQPLAQLAFLPQYAPAIDQKVLLVVRYCEDRADLASCRPLVEPRRGLTPGLVGPRTSPPPTSSSARAPEGSGARPKLTLQGDRLKRKHGTMLLSNNPFAHLV